MLWDRKPQRFCNRHVDAKSNSWVARQEIAWLRAAQNFVHESPARRNRSVEFAP